MNPKFLLTLVMTLTFHGVWSQTTFNPFQLKTNNHSSFYGKVATISINNNTEPDNTSESEKTNSAANQEEVSHTSNESLIEPLLDFNGNEIPKLDKDLSQSKGGLIKFTILLEEQDLGCQNDLTLTLGFDEFSISTNQTNLFLPEGKYFYKIEGNLDCEKSDDTKVSGQGIIDIQADDHLELEWQLIDYQKSWMVLKKSK